MGEELKQDIETITKESLELNDTKMGVEYYMGVLVNVFTFSQSRLFVYSAMMALVICTSAIIFHCAEGPHQLCDLVFYRVLPLFDCVYVCGAIFGIIAAKINHHLLYAFFVMSACCTLTCYVMNVILDIRVLAGPERLFLNDDGSFIIKNDTLTGVSINCTDPVNQYFGQKIDLGIETMGVLTHIFAIILALRQRNKLIEERALKTRESKVIMPLV